ncbi:YybH family protein [Bacteroidota bacterium]
MKPQTNLLTVIILCLVSISCDDNSSKEKEEESIRKMFSEWEALGEKGDMNFMNYYTDDAIWMNPGSIKDVTKEEAYPIYESFLKDYRFDQEITIHEIQICDKWAYVRSTADGWLLPKEGVEKDSMRAISRHLTIVKKQPDGSWKVYRDIYNNPPSEGE